MLTTSLLCLVYGVMWLIMLLFSAWLLRLGARWVGAASLSFMRAILTVLLMGAAGPEVFDPRQKLSFLALLQARPQLAHSLAGGRLRRPFYQPALLFQDSMVVSPHGWFTSPW
jgi:hypothetical protein